MVTVLLRSPAHLLGLALGWLLLLATLAPSVTAFVSAGLRSSTTPSSTPLYVASEPATRDISDLERGMGGRIEQAFASAKEKGEAAFVTFVTAGYPTAQGMSSGGEVDVWLFGVSVLRPQFDFFDYRYPQTHPTFSWPCKRVVPLSLNWVYPTRIPKLTGLLFNTPTRLPSKVAPHRLTSVWPWLRPLVKKD